MFLFSRGFQNLNTFKQLVIVERFHCCNISHIMPFHKHIEAQTVKILRLMIIPPTNRFPWLACFLSEHYKNRLVGMSNQLVGLVSSRSVLTSVECRNSTCMCSTKPEAISWETPCRLKILKNNVCTYWYETSFIQLTVAQI